MRGLIRKTIIMFLSFFMISNLFGAKLFYLSTDKTYTPDELKKVKIETGAYIDSIKLRIYKINDFNSFYNDQYDFHKPVIKGRSFLYNSPDVITGFESYLRTNLRSWVREVIPANNRAGIMDKYPDFSLKNTENYYTPQDMVKYLSDDNFTLITEKRYAISDNQRSWNYNYVFVDPLESGIYLIEGIYEDNVAYTVMNVSNYAFITKKANNKVLVYLTDSLNGEGVSDAEIVVFGNDKNIVKTVKTSQDGTINFELKENSFFITAKCPDGSYTFYDPKYYPSETREKYAYIYTERPVYKGNDTVYVKGIIRNYKNSDYEILTKLKVNIKLINPDGTMLSEKATNITDDGVFYTDFVLPKDTVSGRYIIEAEINNDKFAGEFKVEYYVKPEFEVLVKASKSTVTAGSVVKARITAKYFVGEPLKKAFCYYQVYRTTLSDNIENNDNEKRNYLSEDEFNYTKKELVNNGELSLNENGECEISVNTDKTDQAYTYSIIATVRSESDAAVTGSASFKMIPSDLKIGLETSKFVYQKGEEIEVQLAAFTYDNNPLSSEFDILVKSEYEEYFKGKVKTDAKGYGLFKFSGSSNGFVVISADGKDSNNNPRHFEKHIWIGEKGASYNYSGGLVRLYSDKKSYSNGDEAKVLIVSPVPDIKYLLSVEGDTIYDYKVEKFNNNSSMISIPVKSNYTPNIYLDVSFIFDNLLYKNTLKLSVPPLERILNIDVKTDSDTYSPKENAQVYVYVTDSNGRAVKNANLSIGIVDEAIYGISQEIAAEIIKYFYPVRRNNVMSYFSQSYRFYGYSMDARNELALKYSDFENGLAAFKEGEKERKTFKDTMFWLPSINTDEKGMAKTTISFPDNITKWRITAVAGTKDSKFGKGLGYVFTKLPFYTEISMAENIDELDKSQIFIKVFNNTKKKIKPVITVKGNKLKIEPILTDIELEPNSSGFLKYRIIPTATGEGDITVEAKTSDLKDVLTKKINILPHSLKIDEPYTFDVSKKKTTFKLTLTDQVKKENLELYMGLSDNYLSAITDSIEYLISYPYGCIEQTVSSFLPDLVLLNAMKKLNIKDANAEKLLPDIMNKGLARIYGYQNKNGSFGWFDNDNFDIFMTSYALYALTMAKNLSYNVNQEVLNKGLDFLVSNINKSSNGTEKLYAMYVLGMNGRVIPSVYEDFKKRYTGLNDYELALLLMTALDYKKGEDSANYAEELKKRAKKADENTVYWGDINSTDWFKDNIETTAWCVKALGRMEENKNILGKALNFLFGGDDKTVEKAAQYLIKEKDGNKWKSTRDTAAVVYALTEIISRKSPSNDKRVYTIKNKDTVIATLESNKNDYTSFVTIKDPNLIASIRNGQELYIEGFKDDSVYTLNVMYSYYSNSKTISARSSGLTITRNYYSLNSVDNNGIIKYVKSESKTSFKRGESILVELFVNNSSKSDYLFVEDYFPSGAIVDRTFRIFDIDGIKYNDLVDKVDYRDNKVIFFRKKTGDVKLYYVITPTYPGDYSVLPSTAALMYKPSKNGMTSDSKITIGGE